MSDYDDDFFSENFDDEDEFEAFEEPEPVPVETPPPPVAPKPVSANRPFMLALGVLGALFLLSLIAMIAYAVLILPQRDAQRQEQAAVINAQNTATSQAATRAFFALDIEETSTGTPMAIGALAEATSTSTPVIVLAVSATPQATETGLQGVLAAQDDPVRTQTVAALLTEAAGGSAAGTSAVTPANTAVVAATALPTTGFADEIGLPGLLGISVLLIGIIFLARRMRASGSD